VKTISMSKISWLLLPLCGILALAAPGLAQEETEEAQETGPPSVDSGFYLEAEGGSSRSPDLDGSYRTAFGSQGGDVDLKAGWLAGGAVGFRVNQIRFEVAARHSLSEAEKVTLGATPIPTSGDLTVTAGLANVYYDFDLGWPIEPFIGAGIGVANVKLEAKASGNTFQIDDDQNEIAWNATTGVSIAIADSLVLFLRYRYLAIFDETSLDARFPGTSNGDFEMDFSANDFGMGLRYTF
jgi:opacity protein-like surface antigen